MYYKVIKNNRVIDVLDNPRYVKHQKKHDLMLSCPENEAQGVLSSDGKIVWHVDVFPMIEKDGIDTVELVEIDQYEYQQLHALCLKTPQEIVDAYTLLLLNGGVI